MKDGRKRRKKQTEADHRDFKDLLWGVNALYIKKKFKQTKSPSWDYYCVYARYFPQHQGYENRFHVAAALRLFRVECDG